MTKAQEELARKYGTPEQFEGALYKAYTDLFITQKEMSRAVIKYRDEWKEAGQKMKHQKKAKPVAEWCSCAEWKQGHGGLQNHEHMNFCIFCGKKLKKSG